MGAELKPVSGIGGEIARGENGSEDGGNPSAVLGEPITLDNAGGGSVCGGLLGRDDGDVGEIGQCDGVDWGLLGVEMRRNKGMDLRAADETGESYRRRTQLLRVFLHWVGFGLKVKSETE